MVGKKILAVTLIGLVGVCLLAGCDGPVANAPFNRRAVDTSAFGAEKQAVRNELDRNYSNPDLHYKLAQIHLMEGAADDAEYEYKLALNFDPSHRPSQAGLVKVLVENDRSAEANILGNRYIQELTITTDATVSSEELIELGNAFEEQLLADLARASYEQATIANPKSVMAHKLLGFHYLDQGENQLAKESLTRSFEIDPDQSDVSGALGKLGVVIKVAPAPVPQGAPVE